MRIIEQSVGDTIVLNLRGNLVGWNASRLLTAVVNRLARTGQVLVLDFQHVGRIDTDGLSALVAALAIANGNAAPLRLAHVTARMNDLVVVARLLTLFETVDLPGGVSGSLPAAATVTGPSQPYETSVGLVYRFAGKA